MRIVRKLDFSRAARRQTGQNLFWPGQSAATENNPQARHHGENASKPPGSCVPAEIAENFGMRSRWIAKPGKRPPALQGDRMANGVRVMRGEMNHHVPA
ncbi:MAG: hypothetical protein ACLGSH_09285 [Acidobacteriota bacterium]